MKPITPTDLQEIMLKYPTLNIEGFGLIGRDRFKSQQEQAIILAENRQRLWGSLPRINAAYAWIGNNLEMTDKINQRYSSYFLKHACEISTDYLSHGVFVTAMIAAGYRVKQESWFAFFNISNASIKQLLDRKISLAPICDHVDWFYETEGGLKPEYG